MVTRGHSKLYSCSARFSVDPAVPHPRKRPPRVLFVPAPSSRDAAGVLMHGAVTVPSDAPGAPPVHQYAALYKDNAVYFFGTRRGCLDFFSRRAGAARPTQAIVLDCGGYVGVRPTAISREPARIKSFFRYLFFRMFPDLFFHLRILLHSVHVDWLFDFFSRFVRAELNNSEMVLKPVYM